MQIWGFTLEQPPTLIPCPADRNGVFDSRSWSASLDSTCMEPATRANTSADDRAKTLPVHFSRSEEPLLAPGVHARGFALLILDGTVQGVLVRTSGTDSQNAIYAMLRKKYGVPTALVKKHAQNGEKKLSQSIGANWQFPHLRVSFEGREETTGEGTLSITTASAYDYLAAPATAVAPR